MSIEEKVDPLNYKLFKILLETKNKAYKNIHTSPSSSKKYFRILVEKYNQIIEERFKKTGLYEAYIKKYSSETDKIG